MKKKEMTIHIQSTITQKYRVLLCLMMNFKL